MDTRVNIVLPEGLHKQAQEMIKRGLFSNMSEMIRDGLRRQILDYENMMDKLRQNKEVLQNLKK
jgi:Arc/MetJ-type ribon-helix-helix transcriptional regulator